MKVNSAVDTRGRTFRKQSQITYRSSRHIIAQNSARYFSRCPGAGCNVEVVDDFSSRWRACNATGSKHSDACDNSSPDVAARQRKDRRAPGSRRVVVYVDGIGIYAWDKVSERKGGSEQEIVFDGGTKNKSAE